MEGKNDYVRDLIRAKDCLPLFRAVAHRIAGALSVEYVENFPRGDRDVLVTVLRAGSAFHRSFVKRVNPSELHFIATKRNLLLQPEMKYHTFSCGCDEAGTVIILEPMLATGGTIEFVISKVNDFFHPKKIVIVSAFVSKKAEETVGDKATIIALSKGYDLNEKGYIKIINPDDGGNIVTLDLGDQYCGTYH